MGFPLAFIPRRADRILNAIHSQVRRARRRLVLAHFASLACRYLGFAWSLAAIAIISRAIWVWPWPDRLGDAGWIVGSTLAALAVAIVVAIGSAPSLERAAAEVDVRFGLQERLSSALTLPAEVRQTGIGQALLADAENRAQPIDVRDRFSLAPNRLAWLPLLPAVMLVLGLFLPPAVPQSLDPNAAAATAARTEQVKTASAALKQKLQQKRLEAEQAGMTEAEEFFKKLESELDELAKKSAVDPKETMIAMNDMKKQLDERREQLGSPEQLRQALAKLPEVEPGPMKDLAKAIQQGDFAEAQKQLQSLAEQLRDENLTESQREELKKQIESLRDQIAKETERTAQAKEQLQQQIERARSEGRTEDESKLRQQLAQVEAQEKQNRSLQQLAETMNRAAECLSQGKAGEASAAMEDLADQMGQMRADQEQWEDLQDALESLAQSKQQMRCESCAGQGCQACRGQGQGQGPTESLAGNADAEGNGKPGNGLGRGTGQGERPEEATETGTYDTQVRNQPQAGPGIIAGRADGPNRKGISREAIKTAVMGAISDQVDPLENQTLPRVERDHARDYFDRLRQGRPSANP